jgi:hypothetical protein
MIHIKSSVAGAIALAFIAWGGPANAGTIIGGSALLGAGDVSQLETWLGEGPLALTNVYTKQTGDTSSNFHGAVNGQGRTFTLIELVNGGSSHFIGAYNPQSWHSGGAYNFTTVADRTAFLFNLTDQLLYSQIMSSPNGQYQTYNHVSYGPSFGGGHDLYINSTLSGGYANIGYSYGDPSQYANAAYRNAFTGSYASWTVGGLETFTIAEDTSSQVPEPGMLAIIGLGLIGIGYARRRKSA